MGPKIPGREGKILTRNEILGIGTGGAKSRADRIIDNIIGSKEIQNAIAEHVVPRIGELMDAAKDQLSKPGTKGGPAGRIIDLSKKGQMDGRDTWTAGGQKAP